MGVHDGHRARMKQKYLETGSAAMTDVNLLEMLLFYALPRKDTNELAHVLFDHFGSLQRVLMARPEDLLQVEGIGENAAVLIRLLSDISTRAGAEEVLRKKHVGNSAEAGNYFMAKLGSESREKALLLSLDSQNGVIRCSEINSGSVNSVGVDIRLVAEAAIRSNATSVIFAHNHPDGDPFPSDEDISLTRNMYSALSGIGIILADHIIVSGREYYSFADNDQL